MARQGGAQTHLFTFEHHRLQVSLGNEVEQVPSVLGQGVDEEAVALPLFGQLYHHVRVQPIVKRVVSENGAHELCLVPFHRRPGLAQHIDGGVVVSVTEAYLDRCGVQHSGGVSCHGHRAGLTGNYAQGYAYVVFRLDSRPDLVDHRWMSRTHQGFLKVLHVHHIRAASFRFQRLLDVLDADHQ